MASLCPVCGTDMEARNIDPCKHLIDHYPHPLGETNSSKEAREARDALKRICEGEN